ncbi:UNVERIFIED_CONTAM: hypothetical protein FKN15_017970 [Acipenser sinensis]
MDQGEERKEQQGSSLAADLEVTESEEDSEGFGEGSNKSGGQVLQISRKRTLSRVLRCLKRDMEGGGVEGRTEGESSEEEMEEEEGGNIDGQKMERGNIQGKGNWRKGKRRFQFFLFQAVLAFPEVPGVREKREITRTFRGFSHSNRRRLLKDGVPANSGDQEAQCGALHKR